MWAASYEKELLGRVCPEESGKAQWEDLESGFAKAVFQDRQGIEHLHIYLPQPEGDLWEVFAPEGEEKPLELLTPANRKD